MKISIDTNLINARQKNISMNQIEQWKEEGRIEIFGGARFHEEVLNAVHHFGLNG